MRLSLDSQGILTVMLNKRHTVWREKSLRGVAFFYYWESSQCRLVIMLIPPNYGMYPYLVRGRECSSPRAGLKM